MISQAIVWTIALQAPTIIFAWIIGNALGAMAAYRRGKLDSIVFPLFLLLACIPGYCFAISFVYFFSIVLGWFPPGGAYGLGLVPTFSVRYILSFLKHYTLPFFSVMLGMVGIQAIGMRAMSIYELDSDYVQYCRFIGFSDKRVTGYVFRNAMLPQISGLAIMIGGMVGGALITEIVFSYPGIGSLLYKAIREKDYPLIQGCTLVITISVLIINAIVDGVYGIIDPRIRSSQVGMEQ